ncbi:MAG TPA: hypothetical protein VF519_02060 [Mycobacteriales bacterium]|jgi:hypothetical protein
MSRVRLVLAAGAVAVAGVLPATSASAAVCAPWAQDICETLGVVCRTLRDNPKLPDCPPMG